MGQIESTIADKTQEKPHTFDVSTKQAKQESFQEPTQKIYKHGARNSIDTHRETNREKHREKHRESNKEKAHRDAHRDAQREGKNRDSQAREKSSKAHRGDTELLDLLEEKTRQVRKMLDYDIINSTLSKGNDNRLNGKKLNG